MPMTCLEVRADGAQSAIMYDTAPNMAEFVDGVNQIS